MAGVVQVWRAGMIGSIPLKKKRAPFPERVIGVLSAARMPLDQAGFQIRFCA
jgi:hypothetical protein